MATRTIKLMGKAYSTEGDVSLVVNFNNSEVFNGTVTTVNDNAPAKGEIGVELTTWAIDTSVTGSIPLSITVSGGIFQFNDLIGNYSGFETDENGDVTVAPADYFGPLNDNTTESDGKDNVAFSEVEGEGQQREVINDEHTGDWVYTIADGVTFTCDFVIQEDLVIIEVLPADEPA